LRPKREKITKCAFSEGRSHITGRGNSHGKKIPSSEPVENKKAKEKKSVVSN